MTRWILAAAGTDLQTRLLVSPDEIFLVKLIGAVFGLVMSAYFAVSVWDMLRRKPPAHESFASREELQNAVLRVGRDIERVERQIEAIQNDRKESVKILHGKIDRLGETVSADMKAMAQSFTRAMEEMWRTTGKLEGRAEGER